MGSWLSVAVIPTPGVTWLNCTGVGEKHKWEELQCENVTQKYALEDKHPTVVQWQFWFFLISYVLLVFFAGLMSGLTLAILSLDVTQLEVMAKAGLSNGKYTTKQSRYAHRILPLARRHHVVLVALVLANSLAVEGMPIVLDNICDEWIALGISVSAVLLFGEVLPQAFCSRFGLAIGYYFAWLVWGLVGVTFIIAWPVALLLDRLLGKDHATFYRRAELEALVDMHGPSLKSRGRQPLLNADEVKIIRAALNMTSKNAHSLIRRGVKFEDAYMLPIEASLDERVLSCIMQAGHSRIPVFANNDRNQVVKVLLVKKLLLVDPKKATPLRKAIDQDVHEEIFSAPYFVDELESVHDMLDTFQKGKTHMAFVTKKRLDQTQPRVIIGVVTLENVVEMLLDDDIWDEADRMRQKQQERQKKLKQRDSIQPAAGCAIIIEPVKSNSLSLQLVSARSCTSAPVPVNAKLPNGNVLSAQMPVVKSLAVKVPAVKATSVQLPVATSPPSLSFRTCKHAPGKCKHYEKKVRIIPKGSHDSARSASEKSQKSQKKQA